MRTLKAIFLAATCLFMLCVPVRAETQNQFLILTIDNKVINPVIADYIEKGIKEAQDKNYQGLIIQMDTPGGLLESTRSIVKNIMNSKVPVLVYVAPSGSRAGSAGVFITLSAHIAAMAPSTNIGAAHPIMMGLPEKNDEGSLKKAINELTQVLKKQDAKSTAKKQESREKTTKDNNSSVKDEENFSGDTLEHKVLNDTIAWISAIAKTRNRNTEWAKKAVLESASITEKEALKENIIDFIADGLDDLLKKSHNKEAVVDNKTVILHTENPKLIFQSLSRQQNILNIIIHPNIAYILMLIGLLGLFIEITHPGAIFPGVVGVICLIIAFYAFALLPINFAGFILIALAIILFIAEALTPTFGFFTLTGATCMLVGSLMLVNSPFPAMRVSLSVILPFILAVGGIVIFLTANVIKSHRRKIKTGPEALIGQIALAQTDINAGQEGQVFVTGEIWTAINQSEEPIKNGEKIKVLGVDKVKLLVSKYEA